MPNEHYDEIIEELVQGQIGKNDNFYRGYILNGMYISRLDFQHYV